MKKILIIGLLLIATRTMATVTIGDISTDFTNSGASNTVASTAKNHNAGNAIFVKISSGIVVAQTVSTVTNTAGDTFTHQATCDRTNSTSRIEWWRVFSTAGNASDVVTATWTGNVSFPTMETYEFAHTGTLSFDVCSVSASESAGTSFPVQQFSSAGAGVILVGAQAIVSEVYTAPSGFTGSGDTSYGSSYRITSAVESNITPTTIGNTSAAWAASAISVIEALFPNTGSMSTMGIGK